jgi:beta-aspartyl-dipeptidase (metallo-type)
MKLIRNASVFAPNRLGIQNLLIAGGKIAWMGADTDTLPASLGVEECDLEGRVLLPGLIDGHAHITGGGGESGFRSRVPPLNPGHFSRAGVTSVVGVLGTDDTARDTRGLVAQAYGLREEGLSAWCHTGGYHVPPMTLTGSVRGDIVFIDPIIGIGELAISDHRSSQPTLDEILRIAGDAHVAGIMTGKAGIVHLHLGDGLRGLQLVNQALDTSEIPARVFNPTHVNRRRGLFSEAMELATRGCTIDITAFPVEDGEDAYAAEEALVMYLEANLPAGRVTVSSDGGGCLPHFNEHGEIIRMDVGQSACMLECLQNLLMAGQAIERILPAFTTNVADVLRLKNKGRVGVGLDADFIVLNDDHSLGDVMALGEWHVRGGEQVRFGQFERQAAD